MTGRWTTVDQLVTKLRKRWDSGRYLRDYAVNREWSPIALAVVAPNARDLVDHFDAVAAWLERFHRQSRTSAGRDRFRIEYRTVQSRTLGVGGNAVPARIWIDTFEQLCALLATPADVVALDAILELTDERVAALLPWVCEHPLMALNHRHVWREVLDTVEWIIENESPHLYLRHIDVVGVDTKFVEQHRDLLNDLLLRLLPAERVDLSFARTDFAGRFGFRRKPDFARFRLLSPMVEFPTAVTELSVRVDELALLDPPVGTVFVVENEASYLAFPAVDDSIVLFGSGFALATLSKVTWLGGKRIIYWGDIDTWGFVILNRLRERFGPVPSMLMDHATLLAHRTQWVEEPRPTNQPLPHLTAEETALYRDLIEDRFGTRVRLEQERVRFSLLRQALERVW
ncbi:MAG: Wadjet anti-phage system protein JetD domain-containing protein [Acidimicrobiales bacterium]